MNADKICTEVMEIDPNIRFSGILSKNGTLVASNRKDGAESLLNDEETKMSFHYATQRWESRGNLAHKIGNEKYSMTEYDKIKQISIPLNGRDLLIISADLEANHNKIIEKSLNLIESNKDS